MAAIQQGDKVSVHYRGTLEDGTEFDSSRGGEPLAFTAGGDELIAGVSNAVLGMEAGQTKTVTVPPDQAYGPYRKELTVRIPRERLPEGTQVGTVLGLRTEQGELRARVTELGEEDALVDGNHRLAGKTLVFELEVVSVGE